MHLNEIAKQAFDHACDKGFHPETVCDGHQPTPLYAASRIALIHTEASEALEEVRKEPMDMHAFGEELADIILRTADLAAMYVIDLDSCVIAKIAFNRTRPYRHGRRAL